MKILVINTGSSSIKYQLFDMDKKTALVSGIAERIGEPVGRLKYNVLKDGKEEKHVYDNPIPNHTKGLDQIAKLLTDSQIGVIRDIKEVDAIGHRTVHGGEEFNSSVLITDQVVAAMEKCVPLAPLHNPPNLVGIKVAKEIFPHAPMVGVFDTAFHQTMPEHAFMYALPENLYKEHGVRRYGFHGTSHLYVSKTAAKYLGKPVEECNFITCHVGNGASIAAIQGGKSIDTSMGLTPLEGLIMGTRCGDIDPAIPHFLCKNLNMSIDEVNNMLNKESGMKGISGINDLRDIEDRYNAKSDPKSILAMEMYCYKVKKYIGSYYAVLGRVDAIIFTAGVGENCDILRDLATKNMENLGIKLDPSKNFPRGEGIRELNTPDSKVKILVVPTNEELEIANQTLEVLKK